MTKLDLIESIANQAKITKEDASNVIDSFIESISKELRKGHNVKLLGFGTFTVLKRNERIGRNPKTGESVNIPSKKVVKFKAGLELKNSINK